MEKTDVELSVLVAVYNAENFLEECLESVLSQKVGRMEIIVVNDGSRDKSQNIIQKYLAKSVNMKVIYNQENQGTLLTRIEALRYARGKYVTFIDGDDSYVPFSLHNILDLAIKKDVDILEFGYHLLNVEKIEIYKHGMCHEKMPMNEVIKNKKSCFNLLELYNLEVPLFKRFYSKRLYKRVLNYFIGFNDYKLRFKNVLSEDEFITPIFFAYAKSYYYSNQKIYNYMFQNVGSITYNIKQNTEKMIKSAEDYMFACSHISKELRKKNLVGKLGYIQYNLNGINFFITKCVICELPFKERVKKMIRYYSFQDILYFYIGRYFINETMQSKES